MQPLTDVQRTATLAIIRRVGVMLAKHGNTTTLPQVRKLYRYVRATQNGSTTIVAAIKQVHQHVRQQTGGDYTLLARAVDAVLLDEPQPQRASSPAGAPQRASSPAGAPTGASRVPPTVVGMYRTADGTIYKVQPSKSSHRLYAKRLVPINGHRVQEASGSVVQWEFQYAKGAIFSLTPAMRLTIEEARAFGLKYGVCCVCGATLKDAKSVAAGIGPVCAKQL